MLLATLALALLVGAAGLAFHLTHGNPTGFVTPQDLPADVRHELAATWERFIAVFADRRSCFADVPLILVDDVADGDARYDIDDGYIEVEIPTSPRRFRESLVHELAHHIEHTCPEFAQLRQDFQAALGEPRRPWRAAGAWEERPAELYAEAVVQLVNGERVLHGRDMSIPAAAIEVVRRWASLSD